MDKGTARARFPRMYIAATTFFLQAFPSDHQMIRSQDDQMIRSDEQIRSFLLVGPYCIPGVYMYNTASQSHHTPCPSCYTSKYMLDIVLKLSIYIILQSIKICSMYLRYQVPGTRYKLSDVFCPPFGWEWETRISTGTIWVGMGNQNIYQGTCLLYTSDAADE